MEKQKKTKNIDLTCGNITSSLWKFAVPLMLGNVLQQLYNLVDTWVVGRYIGDNALAARHFSIETESCLDHHLIANKCQLFFLFRVLFLRLFNHRKIRLSYVFPVF